MKYCKDCKWFSGQDPYTGYSDQICFSPDRPFEPVLGTRTSDCAALRINSCGPEAKWFEPREPEQAAA